MQQQMKKYAVAIALSAASVASAGEFDSNIPMLDKGAATYYVASEIHGLGAVDLMVDTGSGYMTINEETLAILQASGNAIYVKKLSGVLADGSTMTVPVYRISRLRIGEACTLNNVEAAVFPGKTRQILGLSALRQAAPFIFSMNPPKLVLSNCTARVAQADEAVNTVATKEIP